MSLSSNRTVAGSILNWKAFSTIETSCSSRFAGILLRNSSKLFWGHCGSSSNPFLPLLSAPSYLGWWPVSRRMESLTSSFTYVGNLAGITFPIPTGHPQPHCNKMLQYLEKSISPGLFPPYQYASPIYSRMQCKPWSLWASGIIFTNPGSTLSSSRFGWGCFPSSFSKLHFLPWA